MNAGCGLQCTQCVSAAIEEYKKELAGKTEKVHPLFNVADFDEWAAKNLGQVLADQQLDHAAQDRDEE